MHKISKLSKKDFTELLSYTKRDELVLPSSYDAAAMNVLFNKQDLIEWKKRFIGTFGSKGILVYDTSSFKVIQNDDYTEWYNKSIEGIYNWTKKYGNSN